MTESSLSQEYYNKGIYFYENASYDLAIENFKKAINLNPSNFQFYYNLGLVYIKLENYDLAIENFKKSIELNSTDVDSFHNLGIAYFNKKEFEKAINIQKKVLKLCPDDPIGYENIGITLFSIKRYAESIVNFKKALELNPNNPNSSYNLAYSYFLNNEYEYAKEYFLYTINLNNQDEESFYNLGNIYLKQNSLDLAKEYYKKTLSINPDHLLAQDALKNLEELEKTPPPEIITEIKTLKETLMEKTKDELKNDLEAEAARVFNKAMHYLKEYNLELALENLKNVLILKNDHTEALEAYNKVQQRLNESKMLFDRGLSLFALNKYAHAINCLQKALEIHPRCQQTKELLNRVLHKKQQIENYKTIYKQYIKNKQYVLAVDTLKSCVSKDLFDSEIFFDLGMIYKNQKQLDLAKKCFKKAVFIDPDNKEAQKALSELENYNS